MEKMFLEHPVFVISIVLFGVVTLYLWLASFAAIARSGYSRNKKITWFLLLLIFPPIFLILLYRHLFHR